MKNTQHYEIVIIGAGLAGISSAYYLSKKYKKKSIVLIDPRPPLSFTTAQSGNNFRNWWPHPSMTAATNRSIELLREIAQESCNAIHLNQSGYLLATRDKNIEPMLEALSYADIREHNTGSSKLYQQSLKQEWQDDVSGVDIINDSSLIKDLYPNFNTDINNLIHLRRAGDIDGQALGQFMLKYIKSNGGTVHTGKVIDIENTNNYCLTVESSQETYEICCDIVVNAAGPFVKQISTMLNCDLDVKNYYQQKILFADKNNCVPRDLPFSIDIDEQTLEWSNEERELFSSEPDMQWLLNEISGSVHCRPEGGQNNNWVKLGWAYNTLPSEPQDDLFNDARYDPSFPEIVLRGASNLNPNFKSYLNDMPSNIVHYGGYYTMTEENWPLISKLDNKSAYIVGALSGFGTMLSCAAGELCADHIFGTDLPEHAADLSFERYENAKLMHELTSTDNKGLL